MSEKKIAIIILALFGVALAGIAFITFRKLDENHKIEQDIDRVSEEIDNLKAIADRIPNLEMKKRDLVGALEAMTQILPNKGDLQHDSFLRLLQTMAENSQVEVRALSVEAEKEAAEKKFARFKYKVEILGTFPQFVNFLNRIETHNQFFKIDSFEMRNEKIGANAWPETLRKEIKLTISTYTYSAAPE